MDYNDIKQLIDDNIKPNTNQDITAIVANLVMTGMIDYTRDSIIDVVNQGFGAGAFTWLDVEHGAVIPYPQMSAGRARVVRILKDNVEYEDGEATIGGVNGVTIKRHALVICLESTNEMANDGMQETVGDRFAVIQSDNEIIFLSEEPTQGVENKLYINLSSGTMKVWHNGGWIDLTFDISHLSNQKYIKYNEVSEQLESGLTTESQSGISVDGNIKGKGFIGRSITASVAGSYVVDFNDMAEQYNLTMTGNTSIIFDNMITEDETVVITLTVTGRYSLLLPSFLVASFENDDYDGSMNNEIVINIKKGGANPLGYYTLKSYEI